MRMKLLSRILQASSRSLSSAAAPVHGTLIKTHARSQPPDLLAPRIFIHAFSRSSFHYSNASSDPSWSVAARVCRSSCNLGVKLGSIKLRETVSPPYLMSCRCSIHSGSPKEFEVPRNARSIDFVRGPSGENRRDLFRGSPFRGPGAEATADNVRSPKEFGFQRDARSMDFVRDVVREGRKGFLGGSQLTRIGTDTNADIVHIKMLKNNTFVTLTDSKGNRKAATSAGAFKGKKAGTKKSRFGSEATAEHIGRVAKSLGSKSIVMKVNGFTFFKKKRQAILSWRDGYTNHRGDQCPVVYIEDTTRLPHNGCRLPKKRSG